MNPNSNGRRQPRRYAQPLPAIFRVYVEFGSSQGTTQICLHQLEPLDGRWLEKIFSAFAGNLPYRLVFLDE
jgi:hypothetical protein